MALSARLQLRQSQSLVMTPQLMQSIKLLQLTHVDLLAFIDQEVERNPLLERQDGDDSGPEPDAAAAREDNSSREDWFEADAPPSSQTIADTMDTSLENVFPDDHGHSEQLSPELTTNWKTGASSGGLSGADELDIGELAAAQPTLRDHVGAQIALAGFNPVENSIAWDLADSLDDAGYLRAEAGETAARLGVTESEVNEVLAVCQDFEPAGLFARDLAECLSLQLRALDRLDPAMAALIDHLELLARRDFVSLRQICGVGQEDLTDMVAEIRALDPRPGFAFSRGSTEAIVADVIVRPSSDGNWAIELNSNALPRVLVDQVYFNKVSSGANKDDKAFLTDCLQSANWLVRSLDQRARTILKVASEIVRQQDGFLTHGVRHLRPMNLKTVAEAIGMHESTVSRVTTHKFMATPRGLFELRYFFTAAIQSAEGGEAHSSESVRHRIRELIDNEGSDVLSDDTIVDVLKKDGVDIARRTVAKYRESMNILSSVQRRREKRAMEAA